MTWKRSGVFTFLPRYVCHGTYASALWVLMGVL